MQTVPETSSEMKCKCTLEQRLAHVGAKLDRLIESAEETQADVQMRGSSAVDEVKTALQKIRQELQEMWEITRDASCKVSEKLLKNEQAKSESESAPCSKAECHRHNAKDSEANAYNSII